MKLSVLALDYDGTITREDRLNPSMIEAIADARRRGLAVMLVTGRRLDDLRRVAGDLRFVDGVVAENGAVVHFPDGGLTTSLAPPIPPAFVARLQKECIPFQTGQCLIEGDASAAPRMLDVIRELQIDQAAALPVTTEAGSDLQVFTIGQRLTPHVRHRQKYVDVPVGHTQAFVFHGNGRRGTLRAHTLREFVMVLDDLDLTRADGYLQRGDFSRWIADVFGDRALARELRGQERKYVQSRSGDAVARIAAAIKSRYELMEENDSVAV